MIIASTVFHKPYVEWIVCRTMPEHSHAAVKVPIRYGSASGQRLKLCCDPGFLHKKE
jgi:hypothetical protein